MRIDRAVHFDTDATRVADGQATRRYRTISYRSSRDEADTALAEAALRAALDAGVPWSDFDRRVVIVWEGADAAAIDRARPGAQVIRMAVPSPPSAAADAVRDGAARRIAPSRSFEPVMLTPEQLRRGRGSRVRRSADAPLRTRAIAAGSGAPSLSCLAVEAWMRAAARRSRQSPMTAEARVA